MKTKKNKETSKVDLRDLQRQNSQYTRIINDVKKVVKAIEKVGPDMMKVSEFLQKKHSQAEVQRLLALYTDMVK